MLVVNKADLDDAEKTARQLHAMLELRMRSPWQPPVIMTRALTGQGLGDLADALQRHYEQRNGTAVSRTAAVDAQLSWPQRLAPRDSFARHLGIELIDGGRGHASVCLHVRPVHINFNGTCHGGVVFALADTAFGLASNSHGAVASGIDAHITYPRAVRVDDTITARAVEETRTRRFATYRVIVSRGDGATVATFTGTVAFTGDAQSDNESSEDLRG